MKAFTLIFAGSMLLLFCEVKADRLTLDTSSISISERNRNDGAVYYHVQYAPPGNIQTVRHAWLELVMDISTLPTGDFQDPTPIFEVFALNQSLSGDPSMEFFQLTTLPMSRPVAVGDRLVKVDITEAVQRVMANPENNYGLVVGTVILEKRGEFKIQSGPDAARIVLIESIE